MHTQTKPLTIEEYTVEVPTSIKQKYQKAYAAFFLHTFLGATTMAEQTPQLHSEFYGPNRNPVKTQENWKNAGVFAHEDAKRFIEERTNSHPACLTGLMAAIGDPPKFVDVFSRTRQHE